MDAKGKKKLKKAVIIALSAFFLIIVTLAVMLWCSLNDQPRIFFETRTARSRAVKYYSDKYGKAPDITEISPIYSGGFMFDNGTLLAMKVSTSEGDIIVETDDGIITDNIQYDEIVDAVRERYVDTAALLSECNDSSIYILFNSPENQVCDGVYDDVTSRYFDGDIEAFLKAEQPYISLNMSGMGYSGRNEEYPDMIKSELDRLYETVPCGISASVTVFDPELQLPEMPDKSFRDGEKYSEYMELIAKGSMVTDENGEASTVISQKHFYDIDEFTAISVDYTDHWITSHDDFTFEKTDLSELLTVHPGRYKYDYRKDENILTIRPEGLYLELDEERRLDDCLIRLDREHYNITDNTMALMVTEKLDGSAWDGQRLYVSFGYEGYECDGELWYYLDDKYYYLYKTHLVTDLYSIGRKHKLYIAFADLREVSDE
ncbi:MAG: hypothetical protein ACI4Q6_07000 [Huintestinicola sp.]